MGKRRYQFDEAKVQKYIAEGRGQGEGAHYRPWLRIHDVPSKGRVHRVFGDKTGRIHHFLSDGEYRFFVQSEWDDAVTDVREQFPLDRELTYRIARRLGIRHPTTTDGTPYVMTTDFLLVLGEGTTRRILARTYKPSSEIAKERVAEKLAIEERYWAEQSIDWRVATEKDVDLTLVRNVERLRPFASMLSCMGSLACAIDQLADEIFRSVADGAGKQLLALSQQLDESYGKPRGTSMDVVKHLLATKRIITDMSDPEPFERRRLDKFTVFHRGTHS